MDKISLAIKAASLEQARKALQEWMNKADKLIAITLTGALLAFTPLYCTAAVMPVRTVTQQVAVSVPMLKPIQASLLSKHAKPLVKRKVAYLPPVKPRGMR